MNSKPQSSNQSLLAGLASLALLASACGAGGGGESDAAPDQLAVAAHSSSSVLNNELTPEPSTSLPESTLAPATEVPTTAAPTTAAPTTTAAPAIVLTDVVIVDSPFGYEPVSTDPSHAIVRNTELLASFNAADLAWADSTIYVYQTEESWDSDTTVNGSYIAAVDTADGVATADVSESLGTGYFRDGIEVGQEGYNCFFWDDCPAGLTTDDYEYRVDLDIAVTTPLNHPDSCVIWTAISVRVTDQCP